MEDCLTILATIMQKAIMKTLTIEQTIAAKIRFSLIANIPVRLTKWKLVFMETAIVRI